MSDIDPILRRKGWPAWLAVQPVGYVPHSCDPINLLDGGPVYWADGLDHMGCTDMGCDDCQPLHAFAECIKSDGEQPCGICTTWACDAVGYPEPADWLLDEADWDAILLRATLCSSESFHGVDRSKGERLADEYVNGDWNACIEPVTVADLPGAIDETATFDSSEMDRINDVIDQCDAVEPIPDEINVPTESPVYVMDYESPDGSPGFRACAPLIPGCVFISQSRATALRVVATAAEIVHPELDYSPKIHPFQMKGPS